MSKHLPDALTAQLPSGLRVHPCRLIIRDGCLMWKDALLESQGRLHLLSDPAHEAHIVKTAARMEELNAWLAQGLCGQGNGFEPWDCIEILRWYEPSVPDLAEGIAIEFACKHSSLADAYAVLEPHIKPHEQLLNCHDRLMFKRC